MSSRSQKQTQRFYLSFFEYILFQLFFLIIKLVPLNIGLWVGKKLGLFAYLILKSRRLLTIDNIKQAKLNGHLRTVTNETKLAQRVWENLGMIGSEFLYYYSRNPKLLLDRVTVSGEEHLTKALEKNRGIILISPHFGNWELAGIYLSLSGYTLNPLFKIQSNNIIDKIIQEKRRSIGMKIIPRNSFLRPILLALKRNEIVPFIIDQADRHGIPVNFFSRPASFPRGAAEFALKTKAPVIYSYIERTSKFNHQIVFSEEIVLPDTGNYDDDLKTTVAMFAKKMQETIEQHPDQWLWMHRLWR
ncbi:MAG TPA: lysophospholipid acyltransferase family protein [Bacillota bacterium]|nr:lysophospholipid acyltransferase family protein [Bacillota bacterium]HOL08705.1 lysophospholipid acyltransferase family protein [Bacillota bacterium]HPO96392.1 lysophospholipid acyltransferase family protein [Bacillota bacterium]